MTLVMTPTGLNIDHDLPPAGGFLNPDEPGSNPFLTATTGIGLGLIALILIAARSPAGLALAWFVLALLPAAYFIPPHTHFNERALYLAIVSVGLALPWIVSKVVAKKSTAVAGGIAAVVLLLAAAAGTFMRNSTWQDEYALWEDAIAKSPGAPEPIIHLGTLQSGVAHRMLAEADQLARNNDRPAAIKRREEALAEFSFAMNFLQQAVEFKPDDANLRAELGITFAYLNRRDDAIKTLTEAVRLNPALQEPTLRLASLYAAGANDPSKNEDLQKALDYFARAARLGRIAPDAAANYAALLARNGNIMAAGQVLVPYVTADDSQSPANAVFQQLKPMIEAARDAEQKAQQAEKANPSSPEAIKLRIRAMLANGQVLPAFYRLERFLQLGNDPEAWLLMGTTCARTGQQDTFIKEYAPNPPAAKEGDQPIWTQLVRQCAEQGRWAAARAYIEYAATQSGAYEKPLYRLGELAIELKQPAIAATLFDEYIKANAGDPAPWLLLCDIAIGANSMPQARRCLDEAERLGADPAAVAQRREKTGVTPESEKQKPRSVLQ
jgi:tetratricopeptide (TPR) repeat protein